MLTSVLSSSSLAPTSTSVRTGSDRPIEYVILSSSVMNSTAMVLKQTLSACNTPNPNEAKFCTCACSTDNGQQTHIAAYREDKLHTRHDQGWQKNPTSHSTQQPKYLPCVCVDVVASSLNGDTAQSNVFKPAQSACSARYDTCDDKRLHYQHGLLVYYFQGNDEHRKDKCKPIPAHYIRHR